VQQGIPSQITASRDEPPEADGISSQSADSGNQDPMSPSARAMNAEVQQGLVRSSMRTFKNNKMSAVPTYAANGYACMPVASFKDPNISEDRQKRWLSLLSQRPPTKEGDLMSSWLMEVLSVSDLEIPLRSSADEPAMMAAAAAMTKLPSGVAKAPTPKRSASKDELSSNDESTGKKKKSEKPESQGTSYLKNGILKKKRPLAFGKKEDKNTSEAFVSGSFAEWKERKRQKKQSKLSSSSNSSSPPPKDAKV
jgi:hypothetical protein